MERELKLECSHFNYVNAVTLKTKGEQQCRNYIVNCCQRICVITMVISVIMNNIEGISFWWAISCVVSV